MALYNVPVERCDIQEIDISIDLPEVVGQQVSSPDDIRNLLVNVDGDDVAGFVAAWLSEEVSSGEFVQAIRHIMYANTMLNVASEMITAAEQEIEDNTSDKDSLCVEEMLLEEVAKRFYKGRASEVLEEDPELRQVIQNQLVGDYTHKLNKVRSIIESTVEVYRSVFDDSTRSLEERLDAAEQLKGLNNFLAEYDAVQK